MSKHSPPTTHYSLRTKEYVRPIPPTWWLKNPNYTVFMIREMSAVFIAGYCVFLLFLLYKASHEDAAGMEAFIQSLRQPLSIILHLVALFFALFNTITFLNLTPRVVVIQRGEDRVPDAVVAGIHYAMFVAATAVLITLAIALG